MVGLTDRSFDNGKALGFADFSQQLVQSVSDFLRQNLTAVFDTPDDVIVDVIDAGTSMNVFVFYTYSIYYLLCFLNFHGYFRTY